VIRAADNGVGLGGASVDTWSDTLGFTLVRNLVENQLGGAWSVKDFDGVHHELRIKIQEPDYLPSDPAADSPA